MGGCGQENRREEAAALGIGCTFLLYQKTPPGGSALWCILGESNVVVLWYCITLSFSREIGYPPPVCIEP